MKISELPTPYRQLAIFYRRRIGGTGDIDDIDDLSDAFRWEKSPEGGAFWHAVHKTRSIKALPDIPKCSYNTLHKIATKDKQVHIWLHWRQVVEENDTQTGKGTIDRADNLQTFKMALECIRDPEQLFLGNSDDLELVYNIAAIIAIEGDITMKQLQRLKNGTYDR